jgi:histidyl-tRNA synthetase
MGLVKSLREKGLRVAEDFSTGPLKSRMKRADRLGARFVIILGDDELESGVVTVKDMESAAQEKVAWDAVGERLGG